MKQIVVHGHRDETTVALLEDGKLTEFFVERPNVRKLVGNIYKGRVVNVLPGMGAAFVDIGIEKNAFLYIDDLLPAHLEHQPKVKPSIDTLVRAGDELLVQIVREPVGTKGARVTTHYALTGRWLVYMPEAGYIALSKKIDDEEERKRLRALGERLCRDKEGVILRTVANGEGYEALAGDMDMLRERWRRIEEKAKRAQAPSEVYADVELLPRLIRDIVTEQMDEIVVDQPALMEEAKRMLRSIAPQLTERVRLHDGKKSAIEAYGVKEQLEAALQPKQWLASGGYVVIDQTEALTVVDVNTGKYTGSTNLEETVLTTNVEAAEEIARQLRLRDIGGIIVIDFIDMELEENRRRIIDALETAVQKDRTKAHIVGWTKLGLLEMTRKKVREQKDMMFFVPCKACGGRGKIRTSTLT
ncbi:Rne/Rng family ribonuclease [Paenibacillus antri]|uniref:Rne/Rng family ribonuclease n=1 Tax=Paenibacillus antri TaxID=2582848 RepID=A0A5R9GGI2_9BACL|nr:Rne/Rng family ribonuclease [Paenibacillus antri]TLS53536.1 Rne/Rng family ribonuclease [Paenibacillus antri]